MITGLGCIACPENREPGDWEVGCCGSAGGSDEKTFTL